MSDDLGDGGNAVMEALRAMSGRINDLTAERDALAENLERLATEARCRCMYESRETERAYENGECDHQRSRATLAALKETKP